MKEVIEMTCISCPVGCSLTVEYENKNGKTDESGIKVTGNTCPRGEIYAKNEVIAPKRTVTTTVRLSGGGTVSVKTDTPAPKGEIFNILKKLKGVEVSAPVKIGQIIYKDICGGVNIVSTQEV